MSIVYREVKWVWDFDHVGRICRERRAVAGLTQDEVGELIGLSGSAYGAIEKGVYETMPKHLLQLANLFEFDPCEAMKVVNL